MNLKRELQNMSILDLRAVCRDLGVSCPKSKSGIIKRLLEPLKISYRMEKRSKKAKQIQKLLLNETLYGVTPLNLVRKHLGNKNTKQILKEERKFLDRNNINPTDLLINRSVELPENLKRLIASDYEGLANKSASIIQRNVRTRLFRYKREYIRQLVENMNRQTDNFENLHNINYVYGLKEDYRHYRRLNFNPLYGIDMNEVDELEYVHDPDEDEAVDIVKWDIILKKLAFTFLNLSGVNLSRLNLIWADFNRKNLKNTNFKNSTLSNVNFKGANLTGANLTGANLTGAFYDENTRFPVGFNPTENGMILIRR